MKHLSIALACLFIPAVTFGQAVSDHAPARPAASESVPLVRLAGKTLAVIARGDYVHPSLSPDGTRLAYSKVVMRGEQESTEILLRDLRRGRTSVLLGGRSADKFATYSAFVTRINWLGDRRLRVRVSDGDVDSTDLDFDTRNMRLIRETGIAPGFDGDFPDGGKTPVPAEFKDAHAKARALFPSFADDILRHTLYNGAFLAGHRGLVLQKNHANEDDNIWLLDFEQRSMRPLIELQGAPGYRLAGGFAFGSSILFLVSNYVDAVLYEHRDGRLTELLRSPVIAGAPVGVEIKHLSTARAVFLLRTTPSYKQGDNPLLLFGGGRLRRAGDHAALDDASIDARGRRIALSFWESGRRQLVVSDLKD